MNETLRKIKEVELKLLQEMKRRLTLPINTYVPDSQKDRDQLSFHRSGARFRLAFGGNRAGKSVVTAYETAAWARGNHRFQTIPPGPKEIYVLSAEYRTLYHGIYRHLRPDGTGKAMRFLDESWIKESSAKVPGATVPLPSYLQVWSEFNADGTRADPRDPQRPFSTIWFISGDGSEEARKKVQSAALDLVVVDEEIDGLIFQELKMRLLDTDGRMCISATMVRSEDWLLDLEDKAEENDPTVFMVRLNTESSPHLSESAKKDVLSGLSDEEKAIRVQGRSRRQFGLVFPEFNREHIFNRASTFPEGIPKDLVIIASTDPGFRVHAGLWGALDIKLSTLYLYREMYEREAMLSEVCKIIAQAEGYELKPLHDTPGNIIYTRVPKREFLETVSVRLTDPAGFRNLETGAISVAAQMAAYYDTPVCPANNDVHSGIEAVRTLLKVNPLTQKPHALFADDLYNLFAERRKYKLKEDRGARNTNEIKAEPLRRHNHLMDNLRYICIHAMALLSGSESNNRRTGIFNHALNIQASMSMGERVAEHARGIRERELQNAGASVGSGSLGSEW